MPTTQQLQVEKSAITEPQNGSICKSTSILLRYCQPVLSAPDTENTRMSAARTTLAGHWLNYEPHAGCAETCYNHGYFPVTSGSGEALCMANFNGTGNLFYGEAGSLHTARICNP